MANYAVIENNIVKNVIVADTKEIAETLTNKLCVQYTESNPVGIGWTYDGTNFTAPVEVVEEPVVVEEPLPTE